MNTSAIPDPTAASQVKSASSGYGAEPKAADPSSSPVPAITLPKGGGAIKGIDEKFAVNPATGTASMSVPIATSPGRSGFGPQLSLSYNSGAGNGPFGFGWSMSLPSITRKTDKGLPRYQDAKGSDVFVLSGAEDLVPQLVQSDGKWEPDLASTRIVHGKRFRIQRYRPRIEGLFARIERWTNLDDSTDVFWRSISRDNITTWYGKSEKSRIFDPSDKPRIFSWLICESYDDKGNVILYDYVSEDDQSVNLTQANERNRQRSANRYLKHIFYGNNKPYFPMLAEDQSPTPLPKKWHFQVVFDYGEHDLTAPTPNDSGTWDCRPDPFSAYRSGFEVRTYRLCQRVLMFHNFPELGNSPCLVRSTDFTYRYEESSDDADIPIYTFLLSVTQSGYKQQNDHYLKKSLPPLAFEYSRVLTQAELDEQPVETLDSESLENLPVGLGSGYQWVDLDGEGISGILTEQAGAWYYKSNWGNGRFGPLETVATKPSMAALGNGRQQLLDLAGDGQLDLAEFAGPTPGFYERTHDENWVPFRTFESLPVINWADPNLRFVDLTGDGHADILITEDTVFTWHLSLAEAGFDQAERVQQALDEEQGPRLIFAEGTQSIFLTDMSGDGLVDLARIRNGEVCYWPNLGYGRFGATVTMDDAPWFDMPDLYDPGRIRLADIDGSGTTDIIYLGRDRINIYRNESGNRWSLPVHRSHFPRIDNLSHVTVVDLTGNGTACLVWSSPLADDATQPIRFIDLMGGQKPHLLVKSVNNLGAETHVQYAPSTKFYLQDKQEGNPWITRLPFPVHVVERVKTVDKISRNRFVTRYAYHHGYFDGQEREFRGFGRVDQWDTEEYAALESGGLLEATTNWDEASHVPPVLTKTWFHTGAYLDGRRISTHFVDEYYQEGDESLNERDLSEEQLAAMRLPDTIQPDSILIKKDERVPWALSASEQQQACRALKGSALRQEVYALDGTEAEDRPYTVSESNFTVEMLQPQGENQHALFFTHPRETINFHYERKLYKVEGTTIVDPEDASGAALDLADPRVTHAMTLSVDEYGNVLEAVAIGYGRRHDFTESRLEAETVTEILDKQKKTLLTYSKNRYTNPVLDQDAYRTPLPCEVQTYEFLNLTPEVNQAHVTNLFRFDEMANYVQEINDAERDIPYTDIEASGATDGSSCRRLVEQTRTLYRSNDLTRLLASEELESLALPGESYQLAFTPELLDAIYVRDEINLLPDRAEVLSDTGGDQVGYVDLNEDGHWWIPSGRIFYHPEEVSAEQELAEALAHFFMPRHFEDPFQQNTIVTYAHDLLVSETQDALQNRISAVNDYRVLQPELVTDPNGNRSGVAFDALGLVVGTAVMGKEGEGLGDLLDDDFQMDLTEEAIADFFADPRGPEAVTLLGTATTRLLYDLDRYLETGTPTFAATLVRETHVSELAVGEDTKIQVNFAYSDGFGRVIQQKAQAEPGPVPRRDPVTGQVMVDLHRQPVLRTQYAGLRWVGSGWTVLNNKGNPVRQYEPFFTDTHDFEFDARIGVSPILCYDPVGRVIATLHPNHTYEKVVFDPWQQVTWDVNDTVLQDDPAADPDIGEFFYRLSADEYLPTWYELRADPVLALNRWPDFEPETDEEIGENADIRARELSAAEKTAAHADTPTRVYFDTLGRPVASVAHNKLERDGATVDEYYPTRTDLDIEGKPLRIIDARGNAVMTYMWGDEESPNHTAYDVAGRLLYQKSMDAGERWMLANVAGNPIRRWDSREFTRRLVYDALQRPTHLWVREGQGEEWLAERTVYGERHPEAQKRNLLGQVFQLYDGAGMVSSETYDFKGNLLTSQRTLANNYRTEVDWSDVEPQLLVSDETLNLERMGDAAEPLLESEIFELRTAYDALNRPIQQITPHHISEHDHPVLPNVIQLRYNEANLLNSLAVWLRQDSAPEVLLDPETADEQPVTNIDYNVKGQRTEITYGNDVVTKYTYDWETLRLTNLHTERTTGINPLQDLSYTYDPAGNITYIRDDAQQTIFFRNRRVEPSNEYEYDPLYRLIKAFGREHLGQNSSGGLKRPVRPTHTDEPRTGLDHPGNGKAMGNYTERYEYDSVGNILAMRHQADSGSWTRCYQYAVSSNRLLSTGGPNGTTVPCPTPYASEPIYRERYTNDVHGSMTTMPHITLITWDFKDRFQASSQQVRENGTPEKTFYVYDAGGQRIRKVTVKQEGDNGESPRRKKERLYLGGFEIFRSYNGDGTRTNLERESLQIMDDQTRVILIETKTIDADVVTLIPNPLFRYQLGNHLNSACVELASDASVISYEEYYPYGSTSFQAVHGDIEVPHKRFRYTGMEQDEETGLNYHRARYYVPWLGRWLSCDPDGVNAGLNTLRYSRNNPISFRDTGGRCVEGCTNDPSQHQSCEIEYSEEALLAQFELFDIDLEIDPITAHQENEEQSERTFMDRGGRTLGIAGGLFLTAIIAFTIASGGVFLLLIGTMALAGGFAVGGLGLAQLSLSYTGVTTAEQDRELTGMAELIDQSFSSPGGLVGSVGGLMILGADEESMRTGADIGGAIELCFTVAALESRGLSRISTGRLRNLGGEHLMRFGERIGGNTSQVINVAVRNERRLRSLMRDSRTIRRGIALSIAYLFGDPEEAIEQEIVQFVEEHLGAIPAEGLEAYLESHDFIEDVIDPIESVVEANGRELLRERIDQGVEQLRLRISDWLHNSNDNE